MKVDSNDPRPPYAQIADYMRQAIRAGDLAPGQRLPSGRDLATQYGVALMTVQRALTTLRDEGLVHSYGGRGTFVHGGKAVAEGAADIEDVGDLREMVTALTRRVEAIEARLDSE